MKVLAFAFTVLLAGVTALPSLHVEEAIRSGDERLITDAIVNAVEQISQAIADAGFDPLIIEQQAFDYALPVPSIFSVRAHLNELLLKGASNIVIKQLSLNLFTLRLTFNIELPEILLSVDDSELDATLLSKNFNGRFNGRLAIKNIVVTGDVRLAVDIIGGGFTIRDIALTFQLGGIDSQLNLFLQNFDLSAPINNVVGTTIPEILKDNESEINELLTIVGRTVLETLL